MDQIVWIQPKYTRRRYELQDQGRILATMNIEGWMSPVANVRTEIGEWSIKRTGVFRPQVTVRRAGSDLDMMLARADWRGNYDLDTLRFQCTSMWRNEFAWLRRDGTAVVRYRKRSVWRTAEAFVEIVDQSEPPLMLVVLGLYLRMLTLDDASAAAMIAAS